MTEGELLRGIQEGWIENEAYRYVTPSTIREARRTRDCPAVRALAWKKYVEAVKNEPALTGPRIRVEEALYKELSDSD